MPSHRVSPGLFCESSEIVTPDLTAPRLGSGSLSVYATPAMVILVERTCATMIESLLPEGHTSVGVELRVRHMAPTPLGGRVRIRAEVESIEDNVIIFTAQIWDDVELVGEVKHKRVIIDSQRFMRRVDAKTEAMS